MEGKRMELIEKLTNELDAEINRIWSEYLDLHEQLNKFNGELIDGDNLETINKLLKQIQDTFGLIYPACHFIAVRHQFVTNAVNSYQDFIETLKKSGAQQDELN
jgi:hypothetical protein